MSLLAEALVEEWLNRQAFFTIRGIREGVREIDLLAIRRQTTGEVQAWHVEVQASFRPTNYLTKLTKERARLLGKVRSSAVGRTPEVEQESAKAYAIGKFRHPRLVARRESLWAGLQWRMVLVHGVVKHEQELEWLRREGIETIPLERVLMELCPEERPEFTAGPGGDLADLIEYYAKTRRLPLEEVPGEEGPAIDEEP